MPTGRGSTYRRRNAVPTKPASSYAARAPSPSSCPPQPSSARLTGFQRTCAGLSYRKSVHLPGITEIKPFKLIVAGVGQNFRKHVEPFRATDRNEIDRKIASKQNTIVPKRSHNMPNERLHNLCSIWCVIRSFECDGNFAFDVGQQRQLLNARVPVGLALTGYPRLAQVTQYVCRFRACGRQLQQSAVLPGANRYLVYHVMTTKRSNRAHRRSTIEEPPSVIHELAKAHSSYYRMFK